ncbi:MAG: alpha/beta fold hydrolase, partial [Deltaproteobacteria bacterium]|nr:alpha/beta fold hydrolase [Deltaproteobacteria bacterium]
CVALIFGALVVTMLLAGACHPPDRVAQRHVACPRPTPLLRPVASGARATSASRSTSPQDSVAHPDPGFLAQYAATYRFRLGTPKAITPTPKGDAVFFLRSPPRSFVHDLWIFDSKTGHERRLFTAAQILRGAAEHLSAVEKARRERQRIIRRGIVRYVLSRDGEQILVPLAGRLFLIAWRRGVVRELGHAKGAPRIDPRLSPDGKRCAYVRRGDLYVLDIQSGKERRLTRRARETLSNGLAEFVAQEEMGRSRGYWWSPDSRSLLYQETDTAGVERLTIADPLHPERAPTRWAYPRAGHKNAKVRVGVINVAGAARGRTRWLPWDTARYPYLARAVWSRHAPPTLVVQSRDQRDMAILIGDLRRHRTRVVHVEHDDAWVEIDPQMPKWVRHGAAFLWTSERSGHKELEIFNAHGKRLSVLTPAAVAYRRLVDFDDARHELTVAGGSKAEEQHLFRVDLLGQAKPRRLTSKPGEYRGRFSRNHSLWIDRFSGLSGRSVTIRRRDGHALGSLRAVAEKPPFTPRLQLLRVGARHLAVALVRPRHFQPGRSYPVIVYVYGGPHYRTVRAVTHRYLLAQWIADHGYLVVSVDGRGTPYRGRAWSRAIKGSFQRYPLADQVAGLKALAARVPEIDLHRVGIFGWSYGGYMALTALLRRPDVYRAAVAGAPVTTWRDYDTHYTERYEGLLPQNARAYDEDSALVQAHRLRRPLLVVHGTADDNVYFSHSIKLSRALFMAGKRFELLPLAGFTHVVPNPKVLRHLYERILGHFHRHL